MLFHRKIQLIFSSCKTKGKWVPREDAKVCTPLATAVSESLNPCENPSEDTSVINLLFGSFTFFFFSFQLQNNDSFRMRMKIPHNCLVYATESR